MVVIPVLSSNKPSNTLPNTTSTHPNNILLTLSTTGCTNDVRMCWHETAVEFRKVVSDEKSLETELKRLSLITKSGTTLVRTRPTKQNKKKDRKKRVTKTAFNAANSHLSGTELGRFIESLNES